MAKTYEVVVMDHDEGHSLGAFEGSPPGVGAEMFMTGPEFGDGPRGESGSETFVVRHVDRQCCERDGDGPREWDTDVVVVVLSEEQGRAFRPRCTCTAEDCVPADEKCDNCEGRLPDGVLSDKHVEFGNEMLAYVTTRDHPGVPLERGDFKAGSRGDLAWSFYELGQRLRRAEAASSSDLNGQVAEFHLAFDQPLARRIGLIPDDRVRLRAALIAEEAFETLEAMVLGVSGLKRETLETIKDARVAVDMVAMADGFADLDYVVEGARLEFGIDGKSVADEVHAANMRKVGGPISPTGKHLKPPGWVGPDIEGVLRRMGWRP